MTLPNSESDAEILCLSCGLCCNGTVHNWTRLHPEEVPLAEIEGLRVFTSRDGSPAFRQPCGAFQEPFCVIYDRRPQACKDYICPLLGKLQARELSLAEALKITQQARQGLAELRSLMPDPDPSIPLDWQVRLNWRADQSLPDKVQPVFERLSGLLKTHWRVTWRRKPSRKRH